MLNLLSLPGRYLKELGAAKVAAITGARPAVISMWAKTGRFPLEAVQKLLDHDATPLHEIQPLYTVPEKPSRLAILLCTSRPPCQGTIDCLMEMKKPEMRYRRFTFNSLYHVRNMAAAWFLNKSGCEWSYWPDDDVLPPCGDPELFAELVKEYCAPGFVYPAVFAGVNSIYRLRKHEKKLIGACYFGRKHGVPGQFAGADSQVMRENLRRGPRDQILPVDWLGFGGILVHRTVFEDIIKTQGEKIRVKNDYVRLKLGYEYSFFWPIDQDWGDDQSFCIRAKEAGHQPWVDLSLMPPHVGAKGFTFGDQ